MGFAQPLAETSTRDRNNKRFWGLERGRRVGLTISLLYVARLSTYCVILKISEPYRTPRSVTGRVYLLYCTIYPEDGGRNSP
jgi:hypothetical protein